MTDAGFKAAVDQMAEVGFEMVIYSFGSGFTLETANATYLAKIKAQVDYARSKGIEVLVVPACCGRRCDVLVVPACCGRRCDVLGVRFVPFFTYWVPFSFAFH